MEILAEWRDYIILCYTVRNTEAGLDSLYEKTRLIYFVTLSIRNRKRDTEREEWPHDGFCVGCFEDIWAVESGHNIMTTIIWELCEHMYTYNQNSWFYFSFLHRSNDGRNVGGIVKQMCEEETASAA